MATLQVTELSGMAIKSGQVLEAIPQGAIQATQTVTYTASAQSAAFNTNTTAIRVCGAAAAHVAFGSNPTATVNDTLIPANTPTFFLVTAGQKIAAYDGTT